MTDSAYKRDAYTNRFICATLATGDEFRTGPNTCGEFWRLGLLGRTFIVNSNR